MNNKKVFILAYAKQNLGDDLFIYMLLKKYPNQSFYINISDPEHATLFEKFSNITIIPEKEKSLTKENAKDYDAYIYIGGSIFMEGGVVYNITEEFLEFLKECKKVNISFDYVSSNFGPFYTKEYVELAKKVYENCSDICFRDKYSYEMFKDIKQVRYAPDLAFAYQQSNPPEQKKNTVGISMIDLQIRKNLVKQEENYYGMLVQNIISYIENQKEVFLFSFCRHEGDENSIKKLLDRIPVKYSSKVHAVYYNGDIDDFLRQYASMEYMICARFHAMILSVVFGQKCRIMSYSDKIDNVIDDLQLFEVPSIHFNELNSDIKIGLEDFEQVSIAKVRKIAETAQQQLRNVEKNLNKVKEEIEKD